MGAFKKIIKIIITVIGVILFIALFMYLFLEDDFRSFHERFSVKSVSYPVTELKIVEPFPLHGTSPLVFDPFSRQILNNVYEPLIVVDEDLNVRPGVAISWGLLNDVTWEFNIRKGVRFHDGSFLAVSDVIESVDLARFGESSELKDLLSTIKEVRRMDVGTIEIETYKPDPLLLQRLSRAYIFPEEMSLSDEIVGTGPYQYTRSKSGEKTVLKRFDDYWGKQSYFGTVYFIPISDKNKRFDALLNGDCQILDHVPYDMIENVDRSKFDVVSVPSLEVQFLGFNFKKGAFTNVELRRAVAQVVDPHEFAMYVGSYAHGVKQFVSSGVFGYNPEIKEIVRDEKGVRDARKIVEESGFYGSEVSVVLPVGLNLLGDYLKEKLEKIGLKSYIQYVKSEYLVDSLNKIDFDIYFLGFKSELGDAADFLTSIVHTRGKDYGQYNFSGYSNKKVDELIKKQEVEMDSKKRLEFLQEAMKILVDDEVFGVPLIEYDKVFATVKWLGFKPRIDGFIYLNNL